MVYRQSIVPALVLSSCNADLLTLQAAKEAKARIPPWEMFKSETDKYSQFDEQVRSAGREI